MAISLARARAATTSARRARFALLAPLQSLSPDSCAISACDLRTHHTVKYVCVCVCVVWKEGRVQACYCKLCVIFLRCVCVSDVRYEVACLHLLPEELLQALYVMVCSAPVVYDWAGFESIAAADPEDSEDSDSDSMQSY